MAGGEHEGLLELFEKRRTLIIELLQQVFGIQFPQGVSVRRDSAAFSETKPAPYAADLVLVLEGPAVSVSVIVEVQRQRDDRKRKSWPFYVSGQWARTQTPVHLVVLATTRDVAKWAQTPIELGHPGFVLVPLVLGPHNVPLITSDRQATENPELAVVSSIAHSHSPNAVPVASAALAGIFPLPKDQAALYLDLILNALSGEARRQVETLMIQNYEPQSRLLRSYLEAGRKEGLAQAKAEDILSVLEARGLSVSKRVAARVLECRDLETLDGWLRRAVTVERAAGLFE